MLKLKILIKIFLLSILIVKSLQIAFLEDVSKPFLSANFEDVKIINNTVMATKENLGDSNNCAFVNCAGKVFIVCCPGTIDPHQCFTLDQCLSVYCYC